MKSIRRQPGVVLGLAVTCWLLTVGAARGQQPAGGENYLSRIHRTWPILRPTFDAPTATVRRLAFSDDPTTGELWLYCAGDDKLVHRWKLIEQSDGRFSVEPDAPIVWPIHTEVRGAIYALDVARQSGGDLLALGGAGPKGPEVYLSRPAQPEAQQVLLPSNNVTNALVLAADLSDDGTRLAVAHDQGKELVRLWSVAPGRAPKVTPVDTGLAAVRWLKFSPDGRHLAIAGQSTDNRRVVQIRDAASPTRVLGQPDFAEDISGIAWRDNSTWLATLLRTAAGGNAVIAFGGIQNREPQRVELPAGIDLTSVAMRPAGGGNAVLAVAEWNANQGQSRIVLRDAARPASTARAFDESFNNLVTALAVSPDGRFLAAAASADVSGRHVYQVRVWNAESGALAAEVPGGDKAASVGGPIARVGVITGQQVEGGSKASDQIAWAWGPYIETSVAAAPFHRKLTLLARETRRPLPPLSEPLQVSDQRLGRILRSPKVGMAYLLDGRPKQASVNPWGPVPQRGGRAPSCFAIHGDHVAIGYADGILVCDLAKLKDLGSRALTTPPETALAEADKAVLRGFYGHASRVTSLSFSTDGKWLASGSEDGTISAWGMGGLDGTELDLAITVSNGQAVVTADPAPYAPAWEAGFRRGHVVRELTVFGRGKPEVIREARAIVARLNRPVPGYVINAVVRVPGARQDSLLTTRAMRDPFWTMYPQHDGNWCIWTPDGHFDCTKGCRDRLRRHVNLNGSIWIDTGGVGESARLFDLDAFRELYIEDAKPGETAVDQAVRIVRPTQRVEMVAPPKLDLAINEMSGAVQLDARPAEGTIESVSIWLNGGKLAEQAGTSIRATIPREKLRSSGNTVAGVARLRVGSGDAVERNVIRPIKLRGAGGEPRVHFLGVGVTALDHADDFAKPPSPLVPLRFTHHDALELANTLRQGALSFAPGSIAALVHEGGDGLPTEENIRNRLAQLANDVAPDDLAIVLLAGHGKRDPGKPFRFIAEDSVPTGGVTDEVINDALSKLSCRTLLLLDTCHSGQAVTEQQLLNWPGMGLGPVVVAACRAGEESTESDSLGVGAAPAGHGMFTAALLEPLTGNRMLAPPPSKRAVPAWDRDADGQLSLGELFDYLDDRTDQMRQELRVDPQHSVVIRSVTFKDADKLTLMPALPTP